MKPTPAPSVAPHGVDLVRFATISASLAEADRSVSATLAAHGLTPAAWSEVSAVWNNLLAEDATSESPALAPSFGAAYAMALDAYRPVPPLSPEDYATLVTEMSDGNPPDVLTRWKLTPTDYLRLSRHFTRAMGDDPELANRYSERFFDLGARNDRATKGP